MFEKGKQKNRSKILLCGFLFLCALIFNNSVIKTTKNVITVASTEELQESTCLMQKSMENGAFCLSDNPLLGGIYVMEGFLCRSLETLFGSANVGDFGAGLGQYGMCFQRKFEPLYTNKLQYKSRQKFALFNEMKKAQLLNKPKVIKSWEGYDGASRISILTKGRVKYIDLTKPTYLNKKYDWVMSLEVGEHIPEKFEDIFMDNLVRHACKGIVLSWAVPGQPGLNHINNKSNNYVIGKMESRGFRHDSFQQKKIRKFIKNTYFYDTLMVFRNTKSLC